VLSQQWAPSPDYEQYADDPSAAAALLAGSAEKRLHVGVDRPGISWTRQSISASSSSGEIRITCASRRDEWLQWVDICKEAYDQWPEPEAFKKAFLAAHRLKASKNVKSALEDHHPVSIPFLLFCLKLIVEVYRLDVTTANDRETKDAESLCLLEDFAIDLARYDDRSIARIMTATLRMNVVNVGLLNAYRAARGRALTGLSARVTLTAPAPAAPQSRAQQRAFGGRSQRAQQPWQSQQSSFTQPQQPRPAPFCRDWNAGNECKVTPCRYRHVCSRCQAGGHRARECRS
jgi:hypothetical protein